MSREAEEAYSPKAHRVHVLHRRHFGDHGEGWICRECGTSFPCRTVLALRGQLPEINDLFARAAAHAATIE